MQMPKYVLCATGHVVGTPQLDIILRDDYEAAIEQAKVIAEALSKAGYYVFDVFSCSPGGDAFDVAITVQTQPAIVMVRQR